MEQESFRSCDEHYKYKTTIKQLIYKVMKNKALIWVLAIAGIALASYITYKVLNPAKKSTGLLSADNLSSVGSAIGKLFGGSSTATAVNPENDPNSIDYNPDA
jgi:hypothetical protein